MFKDVGDAPVVERRRAKRDVEGAVGVLVEQGHHQRAGLLMLIHCHISADQFQARAVHDPEARDRCLSVLRSGRACQRQGQHQAQEQDEGFHAGLGHGQILLDMY